MQQLVSNKSVGLSNSVKRTVNIHLRWEWRAFVLILLRYGKLLTNKAE